MSTKKELAALLPYAGVKGAIWIAMITSLAYSSCNIVMRYKLQDEIQLILEDLSPGGFIASGNREPVREGLCRVMGVSWLRSHDWDDFIPGQTVPSSSKVQNSNDDIDS